ncbi:MAG: fumarate reductase [Betaproteobacteria bacterium RIFCSPLOWO2_02_64_14]|nr:MAG: fumarate reductase [Betaproteobacteria bacterium RIFCSPLOWO2_02_64_14]
MDSATDAFDVVVVGGGGAGLAAASEAARLGRSVVLLEKNPQPGGSTSWSVGSITATNTRHQQRAGILDTPQEHFEDLGRFAGSLAPRDNLALRRILVEHTNEIVEWLMAHGVVFVGPVPEPPHRYDRMHNVVPNSRSFAYHLARHCRSLGVDIRVHTRVIRLVTEGRRVIGVEATHAGGAVRQFHARGGVVLASGDYSGDRALKTEFVSADLGEVDAVNATNTGDGHHMARELGAVVLNGDVISGPIMRFIPPTRANLLRELPPWRPLACLMAWCYEHLPPWLLRPFLMSFLTTALGASPNLFKHGAILVNRSGERYTDELGKPNLDTAKQPDRMAWIVFDDEIAQKFSAWPNYVSTAPGVAYAYLADYRRNRSDIYHRAGTIHGLARSMGIPEAALARTLEGYNATGRQVRPALVTAPFFALGPVKSYVIFTDGGLKVSERLEVLRGDGSVIEGLYAAGATGQGGLLLEGHGHHLGWAFISGRIAGRNAAFDVPPRAK